VGHLIVGYTRGNFHVKDDGVYGFISKTWNTNGYQVGLGTTIGLFCNLALRLDAIYSGYCKQHLNGFTFVDDVRVTDVYTITPQSFDGTVSLIYNF
jgi:opacity protein-like surface antigen